MNELTGRAWKADRLDMVEEEKKKKFTGESYLTRTAGKRKNRA